PEVFGILRARYGLAPEPLELTRRRTELLVELTRKGTVPMPGVPDVPRALHGRGYRLAVASSSAPVVIRATVEALGIASLFEALVSGLDVGRGKPAPDVFVETARRLGLPPRAPAWSSRTRGTGFSRRRPHAWRARRFPVGPRATRTSPRQTSGWTRSPSSSRSSPSPTARAPRSPRPPRPSSRGRRRCGRRD